MHAINQNKTWTLSTQIRSWQTVLCMYQFLSVIMISVIINSLYLNLNNVLNIKGVQAIGVMGSYFSLSYIVQLLSGYVSGRWMSHRYVMLSGIVLQLVGSYYLSLESIHFFYAGATFVLLGGGLSLTTYNIICNSMSKTATERRSIFIKNCLALSIAIFVGEAIIGLFQLSNNFHHLYLILIVMLFGCLLCLSYVWRDLDHIQCNLQTSSRFYFTSCIFLITLLIAALLIASLLQHHIYCGFPLLILLVVTSMSIFRKIRSNTNHLRTHIRFSLFLTLLGCIILLQTMEFLQPMVMMHILTFDVNRHWWHWAIPSTWIDNVRGVVCIILFTLIYLDQKKDRPLIALSLSRRLIIKACYWFIGAGIMMIIGLLRAKLSHPIELIWPILFNIACGVAEVLISLQCYLMVGTLVPRAYQAKAMGMVCCLYGLSSWIAMKLSSFVLGGHSSINIVGVETRWLFANIALLLTWSCMIFSLSYRPHHKNKCA